MIFRLLRGLFRDEEFLRIKRQLKETRSLLARQDFALSKLQQQDNENSHENQKVDVEFLGLLWALFIVILAVWEGSAENMMNGINKILSTLGTRNFSTATLIDVIGSNIVYWGAFIFVVVNLVFGLRLLEQYAESKVDKSYGRFAKSFKIFVIALIIGLFVSIIATLLSPFLQ